MMHCTGEGVTSAPEIGIPNRPNPHNVASSHSTNPRVIFYLMDKWPDGGMVDAFNDETKTRNRESDELTDTGGWT